jgi:hypothetical protein
LDGQTLAAGIASTMTANEQDGAGQAAGLRDGERKMTTSGKDGTNRLGQVGLAFSIIGFTHLFLLGPFRYEFIRYMTLFSLLGLVVSLVGLYRRPRKCAAWGAILGLVGTLYLPTVFLPVLMHHHAENAIISD